MDEGKAIFLEEAEEIAAQLEENLLALEKEPADMDIVNHIFRGLHTIKGSAAMFGFDLISSFVHNVESAFDAVRKEKVNVTSELVNLALTSLDILHVLLESDGPSCSPDLQKKIDATLADFHRLCTGPEKTSVVEIEEEECEEDTAEPVDIPPEDKPLGQILVDQGDITQDDLQKALALQSRIGDLLVQQGFVKKEVIEKALSTQKNIRTARAKHEKRKSYFSMVVPEKLISQQVLLVSKLMALKTSLLEKSSKCETSACASTTDQISKIVDKLREYTFELLKGIGR